LLAPGFPVLRIVGPHPARVEQVKHVRDRNRHVRPAAGKVTLKGPADPGHGLGVLGRLVTPGLETHNLAPPLLTENTDMDENWPPRGIAMPSFDVTDLRAVGWDVGLAAEGSEHAGSYVLQTGCCPKHFAIIIPCGASITHRPDGVLETTGTVTFSGTAGEHDPDCPSA